MKHRYQQRRPQPSIQGALSALAKKFEKPSETFARLPEGTIKSRLHRARLAIKEELDSHTK